MASPGASASHARRRDASPAPQAQSKSSSATSCACAVRATKAAARCGVIPNDPLGVGTPIVFSVKSSSRSAVTGQATARTSAQVTTPSRQVPVMLHGAPAGQASHPPMAASHGISRWISTLPVASPVPSCHTGASARATSRGTVEAGAAARTPTPAARATRVGQIASPSAASSSALTIGAARAAPATRSRAACRGRVTAGSGAPRAVRHGRLATTA